MKLEEKKDVWERSPQHYSRPCNRASPVFEYQENSLIISGLLSANWLQVAIFAVYFPLAPAEEAGMMRSSPLEHMTNNRNSIPSLVPRGSNTV